MLKFQSNFKINKGASVMNLVNFNLKLFLIYVFTILFLSSCGGGGGSFYGGILGTGSSGNNSSSSNKSTKLIKTLSAGVLS